MSRLLLNITTLNGTGSTWQSKLAELKEREITTTALFLTGLAEAERAACLDTIQQEAHMHFPFVHARSDMRIAEFDRLIAEFGTERFNLHPLAQLPSLEELPARLHEKIYIENNGLGLAAGDIEGFAGICLDISHLEDARLINPENYNNVVQLLTKFTLGANHISAVGSSLEYNDKNEPHYSQHEFTSVSQFDYLKNYPLSYFSDYAAIEVNNSIADQIEAKKHIEQILMLKQA